MGVITFSSWGDETLTVALIFSTTRVCSRIVFRGPRGRYGTAVCRHQEQRIGSGHDAIEARGVLRFVRGAAAAVADHEQGGGDQQDQSLTRPGSGEDDVQDGP